MKTYEEDSTYVDGLIYLKIINNEIVAYGDEISLIDAEEEYKTGKLFDASLTPEEWADHDSDASIIDGKIVLGMNDEKKFELQAEAIRNERYLRLRQCDKMSPMHWNALTKEQQNAWDQYRIDLLNIPQQDGFPWDGDIDKVPWPEKPEF